MFGKKNYDKQVLSQLVQHSDSFNMHNSKCTEGLFTEFTNIIGISLRKGVRIQRVFMRNGKSRLLRQKNWIGKTSKKLFAKINKNMQPGDISYVTIQQNELHNTNQDPSKYQKQFFQQLQMSQGNCNLLTKQEIVKKN